MTDSRLEWQVNPTHSLAEQHEGLEQDSMNWRHAAHSYANDTLMQWLKKWALAQLVWAHKKREYGWDWHYRVQHPYYAFTRFLLSKRCISHGGKDAPILLLHSFLAFQTLHFPCDVPHHPYYAFLLLRNEAFDTLVSSFFMAWTGCVRNNEMKLHETWMFLQLKWLML